MPTTAAPFTVADITYEDCLTFFGSREKMAEQLGASLRALALWKSGGVMSCRARERALALMLAAQPQNENGGDGLPAPAQSGGADFFMLSGDNYSAAVFVNPGGLKGRKRLIFEQLKRLL